ncbi:MAG TPA: hypothetical protein VH575_08065 [Gemmataceae bacterium]
MNRRSCVLAGLLVLCCVASERAEAETAKKPDTPRWLNDFDEGRKVARASDKPLFVVFRCEH